jgi:hypothetical protein
VAFIYFDWLKIILIDFIYFDWLRKNLSLISNHEIPEIRNQQTGKKKIHILNKMNTSHQIIVIIYQVILSFTQSFFLSITYNNMYSNWNNKFNTLHWYSIEKLVEYLHNLRHFIINISSKNNITKVPHLESSVLPATENKRFPQDSYYICEGMGTWSLKLDMLNLSMHIMVDPDRLSKRKYLQYQTAGEAEVYAITLINQLLKDIAATTPGDDDDSSAIVTQNMFEKQYGFVWLSIDQATTED